jgi:dCTP deaminase
MGLLVDYEIREEIESGRMKVTPYDPPLINPASLDIRLGDMYTQTVPKLLETVAGRAISYVDPTDKNSFNTITEKLDVFFLPPHKTILVSMFEDVVIPSNISAKLFGKSSLARLGLDNSSPAAWIDAGFKGNIVMELTNHADYSIKLTKGMKIGQLIFFEHSECEKPYGMTGRYQNQTAEGSGSKGV